MVLLPCQWVDYALISALWWLIFFFGFFSKRLDFLLKAWTWRSQHQIIACHWCIFIFVWTIDLLMLNRLCNWSLRHIFFIFDCRINRKWLVFSLGSWSLIFSFVNVVLSFDLIELVSKMPWANSIFGLITRLIHRSQAVFYLQIWTGNESA